MNKKPKESNPRDKKKNKETDQESQKQDEKTKAATESEHDLGEMGFLDHLSDLRKRLLYSLCALAIGFIGAFIFSKDILTILILPLEKVMPQDGDLVVLNLQEGFMSHIKVSILAGFLFALPIIFWQVWLKFIHKGLYKHEQVYAIIFVFITTISFFGGAVFGYFMVFPYGFEFFLQWVGELGVPKISLAQYLAFITRLFIAFGVVFELPVIIVLLSLLKVVKARWLFRMSKFFIVLAVIFAAMITPPDWITQLMIAGPLILLYFIGLITAAIIEAIRGDKKTQDHQQTKQDSDLKKMADKIEDDSDSPAG